ncbi:MAG: selenocysteine synthase [Planctomycetes bacterium]|nr:selenocysteine synthase [Planctomycetota bacterium]
MPADIYGRLGIPTVINAVGYATRVGGSCPDTEVVEAMASASARYVEIDDLQDAANDLIRRATGAEAGIVTCGAAAALTLAAAACLAGNDPEIVDQLPDTTRCRRREIIYPAPGPFDYDHAIRMSGALLVVVDYAATDALARIEQAINDRTAAIGFVWMGVAGNPRLTDLVALAHRHGLPVIVDGAFAMPPVENLTELIRSGADLVAYSGGKHLGGPQASGILCGRGDLIRSAWVQMVDMDVRRGTWSLQSWVECGWIARPPRHGIGRSMKVSKESIVGVMVALQRYAHRDHAAEQSAWQCTADEIYAGLRDLSRLRITRHRQALNGQPYAMLEIESGSPPDGFSVRDLILACRKLPRKILLAEDERSPDRAFLYTQCLQPGDAAEIIAAFRAILLSHDQLVRE